MTSYGLFSYWKKGKYEILSNLIFPFIAIVCSAALTSGLSHFPIQPKQMPHVLGVPTSGGKIERISINNGYYALEQIPTQFHLFWYTDSLVLNFGQHQSITVAFTSSDYFQFFSNPMQWGGHPKQCDLQVCRLSGVVIGQRLQRILKQQLRPQQIQLGGHHYKVQGVTSAEYVKFNGQPVDLVIDIYEIAQLTDIKETVDFLYNSLTSKGSDISPQQVVNYFPIFRAMVILPADQKTEYINQHLTRAYAHKPSLNLPIKFVSAGVQQKALQLFAGHYFDLQAKSVDEVSAFLLLLSSVTLATTLVLGCLGFTLRHALARHYERGVRFALGATPRQLAIDEFCLTLPIVLLSALVTALLCISLNTSVVNTLSSLFSHMETNPEKLLYTSLFLILITGVSSALISALLVFLQHRREIKLERSRAHLLMTRAMNCVLYMLSLTVISLTTLTCLNVYHLQSKAKHNLSPNSVLITLKETDKDNPASDSIWRSVWTTLTQEHANGVGAISMPPGKNYLMPLTAKPVNSAQCTHLNGWKNTITESGFKVLGIDILAGNVTGLSSEQVAISHSVVKACGWTVQSALNQYIDMGKKARRRVSAVVADVRYNVYGKAPEYVFYTIHTQPDAIMPLLFSTQQSVSEVRIHLSHLLKSYHASLQIDKATTIGTYIDQQLKTEYTLMSLTLFLSALSTLALCFSLSQQISRNVLNRQVEWGIRQGLGATRQHIHRLAMTETCTEWLIGTALSMLLLIVFIERLTQSFPAIEQQSLSLILLPWLLPLAIGILITFINLSFTLSRPVHHLLTE